MEQNNGVTPVGRMTQALGNKRNNLEVKCLMSQF